MHKHMNTRTKEVRVSGILSPPALVLADTADHDTSGIGTQSLTRMRAEP